MVWLKKKGQASPDFAMSAMIFSLAVLFVFFHLSRTYYSKVWEVSGVKKSAEAQNLALFLVNEEGNWSENPFNSSSIAFGGQEINETRMQWFFGMSRQTAEKKLGINREVYITSRLLPTISITSDIASLYKNSSVKINFETSENSTLHIIFLGVQENQTKRGYSYYNQSTGKVHTISQNLPWGVYTLKALAVGSSSNRKYGVYEAVFRVAIS